MAPNQPFDKALYSEGAFFDGFEFGPVLGCHCILEQEQLGIPQYHRQGIINLRGSSHFSRLFERQAILVHTLLFRLG